MELNKNKSQIILFANTLWFLMIFKNDLIQKLSFKYQITCYFLKYGDLDNYSIEKQLKNTNNSIKYIKVSFWILIKEFWYSLLIKCGLKKKGKERSKILIFTIVPIFLSPIIFFSNQSSLIYVLEGLGRVFSSRRIIFRILKRVVEFIYRIIFKRAASVVVLNSVDAAYLTKKKYFFF